MKEYLDAVNRAMRAAIEMQEAIEKLRKATPKDEEKLPESWDELKKIEGYYVATSSMVGANKLTSRGTNKHDRNIWPTKELADAALAMSQLAQLRQEYWRQAGGWMPDWEDGNVEKYCIFVEGGKTRKYTMFTANTFLAFPTEAQRDHFAQYHFALIELAKPLL